jgi:hypothetical protein
VLVDDLVAVPRRGGEDLLEDLLDHVREPAQLGGSAPFDDVDPDQWHRGTPRIFVRTN